MSGVQKQNIVEDVFKQIGDFGPYQLFLISIISAVAIVPSLVSYGYSFYGALPDYRCKIPTLNNDTYEIWGDYQQELINQMIPKNNGKSLKSPYDGCYLKTSNNETNQTLTACNEWVYSKKYFDNTIISQWNLVCEQSVSRSTISTLFFAGSLAVFINGMCSDKFGRKKTIFYLMILNAIVHVLIAIILNIKSLNADFVRIAYTILRFLSGHTSNNYTQAVVLAVEVCGPSRRVTAVTFANYFYVISEFIVVLVAYFVRSYDLFVIVNAAICSSFLLYFWMVPESPRWLIINKSKFSEANKTFKRIAKSNGKSSDCLDQFDQFPMEDNSSSSIVKSNSRAEIDKLNSESQAQQQNTPPIENITFVQTFKLFFKSKKLIMRTAVLFFNWLANVLVYYGISFNTADLAGDPYLNFTISAVVELIAMFICDVTLTKFGRKIPYVLNMAIAGVALTSIMFIPTSMPFLITAMAMVGKFAITFTFNVIFVITAELYPTVIRNSAMSINQTFGRFGAIISPNIQLLGDLIWYPLPFLIYGLVSVLAAISYFVFMPETKNKKLPDTIEEFINDI